MKFNKISTILPLFVVICTCFMLVGCGKQGQDAPTLSQNEISVNYQSKTITINLDDTFLYEYSKDNGVTWQVEKTFYDVTPGNYSVVIRYKETDEKQASSKSNVINVVMKAVLPTPTLISQDVSVSGTTITVKEIENAEYSKDNGTTWQDSNVFSNLQYGSTYQIVVRQKATQDAVESNNSNMITVTIPKLSNAPRPVLTAGNVIVNHETATITVITDLEGIEYSFDNGVNWTDENSLIANRGETYKVVIRYKETATTNASVSSQNVTVTIKDTQIAPALQENEIIVLDNVITVNKVTSGSEILEYRFSTSNNAGVWQSTNTFIGNYGTEYLVSVRLAGDENKLASNASNEIKVVLKAIQQAPENVNLLVEGTTITVDAPIVEGKTLCFSKDNGTTWQDSNVFENCTGDITILAKYKETNELFESATTSSQINIWDGSTQDVSWYNNELDTFTLSKAQELAGLAKLVEEGNNFEGKTISLSNDIYLGNFEWTPIGIRMANLGDSRVYNSFGGTFNGSNHTVYDLKISENGLFYTLGVGLFGCVDGATIKNTQIARVNIEGAYAVGAFVGQANGDVTLENLHTLSGEIVFWDYCGAGIIGEVDYKNKNIIVNISNCSNNANVSSKFTTQITGSDTQFTDIYGTESKETVYYDYLEYYLSNPDAITGQNAGGIWGSMNTGDNGSNVNLITINIANCTNSGNITAYNYAGGIAGFLTNNASISGIISDCSNTGDLKVYNTNGIYDDMFGIEDYQNYENVEFETSQE